MYNENAYGEIPNNFSPNVENMNGTPVFEQEPDTRHKAPPRKNCSNDIILMLLLMSLFNTNERNV